MGYHIDVETFIDTEKIAHDLSDVGMEAGDRGAGVVRDRARKNIRDAGRVDTGALMQSVQVRRSQVNRYSWEWQVFSPLDYAIYQEEGVEPFGPKYAKALRWPKKGGGGYIFSMSSSGFDGIHFLKRAAASLTLDDLQG